MAVDRTSVVLVLAMTLALPGCLPGCVHLVNAAGAVVDLAFRGGSGGVSRRVGLHGTHTTVNFSLVRSAQSAAVQLSGGIPTVGMYYSAIRLGGQEVHVQVDTGSSTLAAPFANCRTCRKDDRRYDLEKSERGQVLSCDDPKCDGGCSSSSCEKCGTNRGCCSSTYKGGCHFHLSYADGSGVTGALVRDEIEWGGIAVNATFGGIATETSDFERESVDGIIGLGFKDRGCHPVCFPSVFTSMVQQNLLDDIFSLCILLEGGRLTLGAMDSDAADGEFHFESVLPTSIYWTVTVTPTVGFGDKEVTIPRFPSSAVVDSGTTLLALPQDGFDAFKKVFKEDYCHVPGLCTSDSWFEPGSCGSLTESDVAQLPDITITLKSNYQLRLTPRVYMIPYTDPKNSRVYMCLGIMTTSMPGEIVLGNTVMREYVTVYDRVNQKVGFAKAKPNCGRDSTTSGSMDAPEEIETDGHELDLKDDLPVAELD